jgi:3-mercaptopyruvate sulfurtransferase SseA
MRSLLFALTALAFLGCQMKPTKVSEVHHREFELLVDKTAKPLKIEEGVVVLDARSSFSYGLNHINGAISFGWEKLTEDVKTGELLRDKTIGARRLSLVGIKPRTPVIVVGEGPKGNGAEGRLAWQLIYFGLQDVQTANNDLFRDFWTPNATPDPQNAEAWEPAIHDEFLIPKAEFVKLAADAKGRVERRIFLIDARPPDEYLKASKKISKKQPDIGAINVPWTEFFKSDGRPNPSIQMKLETLGIKMADRIVFSSAPATAMPAAYALIALGFRHVQVLTP